MSGVYSRVSELGRVRSWISLLLAMVACSPAIAQDRDAPGRAASLRPAVVRRGQSEPIVDGHGWMAMFEEASGATLLLHLPPRAVSGVGEAGADTQEGVVRTAIELSGRVDAVARWRERVYVAMAPTSTPKGGTLRRVGTLAAIRGMGFFYEYVPTGRMEELTPIEGSGEFLGFAATGDGPAALLRDEHGAIELRELVEQQWKRVSVPWSGEEGIPQIVSWRDGLAVAFVSLARSSVIVWVAQQGAVEGASDQQWRREEYPLGELTDGRRRVRLCQVQGQRPTEDSLLAIIGGDGRGQEVRGLRPGEPGFRVVLDDAPPLAMIAPMDAPKGESNAMAGSLALVWPRQVDRPEFSSSLEVREISALSGRLMYAGPSRSGPLASRVKLQSLMIWGVMFGVGAVFFLLRADPRRGVGFSEVWRPASAVRRALAAVIDYLPGAVLVAIAQGRSALVLLSPQTMIGGGGDSIGELDLVSIGIAMAVTAACATICEWRFGRSIGKFVVGLKVISIDSPASGAVVQGAGGGARPLAANMPHLWQAAVRNAIRWGAPPLSLFAVFDDLGRHPGDIAARTLVIADENDGR